MTDTIICSTCRIEKPSSEFYSGRRYCKKCAIAGQKAWVEKSPERIARKKEISKLHKRRHSDDFYKNWLLLLSIVKAPQRLTEEQWVEACRYFKGCAVCGEASVEVRDLLIRPSDGGTYSAINVLPLCAACGSMSKQSKNPFLWVRKHYPKEIVISICTYLVAKIKEAYDAAENNGNNNDGVR